MSGSRDQGLHYTASSRFTNLADIKCVDLNEKAIRTSKVALEEMERLRTHLVKATTFDYIKKLHGAFSISHQNARSLHAHIEELRHDPYVLYMDILTCTETRADPTDVSSMYHIPEFATIRADDSCTRRGPNSIIAYIRQGLTHTHRRHTANDYIVLHITIQNLVSTPVHLLIVYRRPNTPFTQFHTTLLQIVKDNHLQQTNTVILGDFNMDLLRPSSGRQALITSLPHNNFSQLIQHNTTPQGSLLDHIWSTIPGETGIYPTYWSDHAATIARLALPPS